MRCFFEEGMVGIALPYGKTFRCGAVPASDGDSVETLGEVGDAERHAAGAGGQDGGEDLLSGHVAECHRGGALVLAKADVHSVGGRIGVELQ